jgi:hypothetical protein
MKKYLIATAMLAVTSSPLLAQQNPTLSPTAPRATTPPVGTTAPSTTGQSPIPDRIAPPDPQSRAQPPVHNTTPSPRDPHDNR